MNLPCPYTLGVRRHSAAGSDAHGNPVESFGAPVDWPVHGIAPGSMEEPGGDRDLSIVAFTVIAPADALVPDESDVVLYGGAEYQVIGRPKDYSLGPFQFAAGVTVELSKTSG